MYKVPWIMLLFSSSFLCHSLVQTSHPAQLRLHLSAPQGELSSPPAHYGELWSHEYSCQPLLAAVVWLDWRWGPQPWWDKMKNNWPWILNFSIFFWGFGIWDLSVKTPLWSLPVIHRNLNAQLLHEKAHDIITLAMNFQLSEIIFWCPLYQKHSHINSHWAART